MPLNLARTSDWELLPAWLEGGEITGWGGVAAALRSRAVRRVPRAAAGCSGLPWRRCGRAGRQAPQWCREIHRVGGGQRPAPGEVPLVVDLSALWAGPLCTHLLQLMGAQVIKVESTARPDGMRRAGDGFYDLLNAGKASVALDLAAAGGREQLRGCCAARTSWWRPRGRARCASSASMPRQILEQNPGLTWISITGHGREGPSADWVAFGDDGAVAGGLSQVLWDASGRAMFCADAIADPLTGLHAALAAWVGYRHGGGRLWSLALADVVGHGIRSAAVGDATTCRARTEDWAGRVAEADVASPSARAAGESARALGADTAQVLARAAARRLR